MFGDKQRIIARIVWYTMILLGLGSFLGWFYEQIVVESPNQIYTMIQHVFLPILLWIKIHAPWIYGGWSGWLFWAFFTRFFIRLDHPTVPGEHIGFIRQILGWISFIIFISTFAYNGIYEIPRVEPVQFKLQEDSTSAPKKFLEMKTIHDIQTTYNHSFPSDFSTSELLSH